MIDTTHALALRNRVEKTLTPVYGQGQPGQGIPAKRCVGNPGTFSPGPNAAASFWPGETMQATPQRCAAACLRPAPIFSDPKYISPTIQSGAAIFQFPNIARGRTEGAS